MAAVLRMLLIALLATLPAAGPTSGQEEPPPPKASPVISVSEESLPRAGGIMVFGGTGALGMEVVKQLVAKHEHVTVLTRATSDAAALKALNVNVVTGDALDPESLKKAFTEAPFRAAISVLGGHKGDYRVDSEGNKNVIDATKAAGLTRLILVSAIGAGDSAEAPPWIMRYFLKDYFEAKTVAENYLKSTDLDYTIIRPGILLNSPKAGDAALTHVAPSIVGITRADLGKLVAGAVEDKATFRQTYAAVDVKRTGLWALLTY
jgi:uncharacterized protein YbjT (DUF2867 family)